MPHPMKKRKRVAPDQEASIDITMKSLRNPPLDITLPNSPLSTSILSLKKAISEKYGIPTEKIRILLKKKPCPDLKSIKDLVPEGEGEVEFSIMVIGGMTTVTSEHGSSPAAKPTDRGANEDVLLESEFWDDLKGFLSRRLKDEAGAERIYEVFRKAWDRQNAMQS
jgi:ubiquitin-like protein 4